MSALLYFFPQHLEPIPSGQVAQLPAAAAATLAPVLAGGHWSCAKLTSQSPAGAVPGALLAVEPGPGGAAPIPAYQPARQTWIPCPSSPEVISHWLGWETATPPTPDDLARGPRGAGFSLRIRDQLWILPEIAAKGTTLPRGFCYRPGAAEPVVERVYSGYTELVDLAARWREALARVAADDPERGADAADDWIPSVADAFRFAVALLGVHYRIGPWEASVEALDLVNADNVWFFVWGALGALDALAEQAAQKKTSTPTAGS